MGDRQPDVPGRRLALPDRALRARAPQRAVRDAVRDPESDQHRGGRSSAASSRPRSPSAIGLRRAARDLPDHPRDHDLLLVAGLVRSCGSPTTGRHDRHRTLRRLGEPAAFPATRAARADLGITVRDRARFAKLVIPGLLISIGAGQVIPFLNLYVQRKFGLDLAQLNAVFALTSLGTVVAILLQPRLARRFGQITSVVIVQGASIPFLVVLGFSPVLWTVILAMAVRNSLMNAGNPIFNAFAMEQVTPGERATLAAAMSVLWQAGWVIGGTFYALLQATVGFDDRLRDQLRHDHHAVHDRDDPLLGVVPARRPGPAAAVAAAA